MKNINDYKNKPFAFNCKTQHEWDEISKLLGYEWTVYSRWDSHGDDTCICANISVYGSSEYIGINGYKIIPASEFIPKRPKQIPINPLFDEILNDANISDKLFVIRSLDIASKISKTLDEKEISMDDFAFSLEMTIFEVEEMLSGFYNYDLKLICKIEEKLDIKLWN